ncbi:MAG TPA: patatin-like phospholipase family protein [Candidatus Eisenbacteria bacterium]|nr:patatin-like phospholipase family protein [Candidatus Eisenbacteria bacterium]
MAQSLRPDLPFKRIAVVVSGGGAFGAYEVGVLKALEEIGLTPTIVAGASAGALNAVAWVAEGFRTGPLEKVWRSLEPGSIGMRWTTLAWRGGGLFLLVLGLFEALVTWIGTGDLGVTALFWRDAVGRTGIPSALLDLLAWLLVAAFGLFIVRTSRDAELWLARIQTARSDNRIRHISAFVLGTWALLHILTWVLKYPWPHRFSATLLAGFAIIWFANRPVPSGDRLRRALANFLPESKGRGLWTGAARRRILDILVKAGDSKRLLNGDTKLILSALALDTGRLAHFVNWPADEGKFRERIEAALGEVIPLQSVEHVLQAAIASSAIPLVFEPARVQGREFVDAIALSTHPLQSSIFAGADAALVIVVSPSGAPPNAPRPKTLMDVWARFLDLANWHDLQREMMDLPDSWLSDKKPCRLCVVEPAETLPGGVLAYSPKNAVTLIKRGERDAWVALERAGWLDS